MRSSTVLAILVPFLLFPQAGAGSANVFLDASNDSGLWGAEELGAGLGVTGVGSLADCQSPAADITQLAVVSDDETLTLALSMASLADLEMNCSIFFLEGTSALYSVRLDTPDDEIVGSGFGLRADARTTGFGIEGCIQLGYADAHSAECMGGATLSGDTITWTVPLSGIAIVELDSATFVDEPVFEERAYDLRGVEVMPDGDALVLGENLLGLVSTGDFVSGEPITL